jgi:hypothetical protein
MAERTVVFSLSDAMFARHQPSLGTLAAHSTAMLQMHLASERSAEPWNAHGDDRGEPRFHSLGMASERGRGLMGG